jgi:alkylated DNA nucleotide flippase Atl1
MPMSALTKMTRAPGPSVKTLSESKGTLYPPGRMLISSPAEIQALVAGIPAGQVATLSSLRSTLSERHGADYTCPMTTGIFLRIVAEATLEAQALNDSPDADATGPVSLSTTPWWRVVRDDGSLLDKLPGGVEGHRQRLVAEGIPVGGTPKKLRVLGLDGLLWQPL